MALRVSGVTFDAVVSRTAMRNNDTTDLVQAESLMRDIIAAEVQEQPAGLFKLGPDLNSQFASDPNSRGRNPLPSVAAL